MGEGTGVSKSGTVLRNSRERAQYGCTTTWENAAGRRLVLSRVGPPSVVLRRQAEDALALDETFRLVCYSTPETIYTDLQGARLARWTNGGSTRTDPDNGKWAAPIHPEAVALGMLGLRHLAHPRILA
jgi:hypothetical protein